MFRSIIHAIILLVGLHAATAAANPQGGAAMSAMTSGLQTGYLLCTLPNNGGSCSWFASKDANFGKCMYNTNAGASYSIFQGTQCTMYKNAGCSGEKIRFADANYIADASKLKDSTGKEGGFYHYQCTLT